MLHARSRRGMSLVETLIAVAIGLIAASLIVQVFILTLRTTEQTAVQADTQQEARTALARWDSQLRDAYAVLTQFTPPASPTVTYRTQFTANEQTIVAALPALDGNGNICSWRGSNLIFDCVIWRATKAADGTWSLMRHTFVNAFQMPARYFTLREPDPSERLFTSLICGQTTGTPAPYTIPTSFARAAETSPVKIFSRASALSLALYGRNGLIAPTSTLTAPPAINTLAQLPLTVDAAGVRTTTLISPTGASKVTISLRFSATAAALATGRGSVTESETQSIAIDLRNWPGW